DIDEWLIGSRDDQFRLGDDLADKKLYFVPETTGPNMVVKKSKGDQYPCKIKESVVTSFQWVWNKGVMAGENMRGICFEVCDVNLNANADRLRVSDVSQASTNAIHALQLTAEPRLLEPVYLVEIQSPGSYLAGIHSELNQRRGHVLEEKRKVGTPFYKIRAYLPVAESFGFSSELMASTNGNAFPQCVFDHWEMMSSDPLNDISEAGKLVATIRKMKGLHKRLPQIFCYQVHFESRDIESLK
ncbi:elongation factor 2-like protein, partial [Tanacetum coccineum]